MKSRSAGTLLATFTALALLLGSSPASAGSVSWEDKAGDATYFYVASGTPNEKAFDITKVTVGSDGANFTYKLLVPEMTAGNPSPAYGYIFRMYFTVEGKEFYFRVGEAATGKHFELRSPADTAVECKGCTGVIDRKDKHALVTAPLASLINALKAGGLAEAAPGAEVTALEANSQRYVAATLNADTATAPEGTSFTL